jgi:hypothetical protein
MEISSKIVIDNMKVSELGTDEENIKIYLREIE